MWDISDMAFGGARTDAARTPGDNFAVNAAIPSSRFESSDPASDEPVQGTPLLGTARMLDAE
jgi:hypothetical protein